MDISRSPWLAPGRQAARPISQGGGWILERLSPVPPSHIGSVLEAGLDPSAPETVVAASDLFQRAAELIALVPDLHHAVEASVLNLHPLDAPPEYDVSHSEPRWRTTVFVSVPEKRDVVGALRLAEGIVHEGMHLLLTDWERAGAFVSDTGAEMHSPWRGMARPAQGVLHGTFVFVCITAFLSRLPTFGLGPPGRRHVERRLHEISSELEAVDLYRLRSVLTPRGISHLEHWSSEEGAGAGPS